MKLDIRRLFLRSSRLGLPLGGNLDDAADTNFHQGSGSDGEGLEAEYRELISGHFVRWGIRTESVTIEVKKSGQAADGLDVFVAMVRLLKWDQHSGVRLLLGLPLMENKPYAPLGWPTTATLPACGCMRPRPCKFPMTCATC